MTQSLLYIIINHTLDFSKKENCIDRIINQSIEPELKQYLLYVSHITNTSPEDIQPIQLKPMTDEDTIWLTVNDIDVKIHKHSIQLCFPFNFRVFFDYEPLRNAIEQLLRRWFVPIGTEEYIAYPSFWQQSSTEVRNPQHEKRLAILQDKICRQCVSYKRTKLNLELCLSHAIKDPKLMANKQYKSWFIGIVNSVCL